MFCHFTFILNWSTFKYGCTKKSIYLHLNSQIDDNTVNIVLFNFTIKVFVTFNFYYYNLSFSLYLKSTWSWTLSFKLFKSIWSCFLILLWESRSVFFSHNWKKCKSGVLFYIGCSVSLHCSESCITIIKIITWFN